MGIITLPLAQRTEAEKEIQRVLKTSHFAILATQYDGQPHASLMAFMPYDGLRYLIVATYRNTLKYRNVQKDGRVAMLIDSHIASASAGHRSLVLTAHGMASDVPDCDHTVVERAFLEKHSNLRDFLASPDCVMLRVLVTAYEVVGSTDDVIWYQVADAATG